MKANWQLYRLSDLGSVERGRSRHRPRNDPDLYDGVYPFFQTGDVKAADLYLSRYTQTYNEKGLAQSRLWAPGTLCITIAANIADTAILSVPGCFPDSVVGFVAEEDVADVKFVKYLLSTLQPGMQSAALGTTQDNLSLEKLLSFRFAVPPLDYQKKVASVLSAYDDLIENTTRRIEILEEISLRLYEEWFVKFRTPIDAGQRSEDCGNGELPEGWELQPLANLYETKSGGTPSRKRAEYFGTGIPWIKTKELKDGPIFVTEEQITEEGLSNSSAKLLPKDTVLIAMYGATIGKLGILDIDAATNQACCAILPRL